MSQTLLRWPSHFPPTRRWKKFFIGVRWLGPDLSFFEELRNVQASRTEAAMQAWPGDELRTTALFLGGLLKDAIGWPTPFFMPGDMFEVIAYGPKFQSMDELLFGSFWNHLEEKTRIEFSEQFWTDAAGLSFGELVERVTPLVRGRAPAR